MGISTREAISLLARELSEELVVCTTGYTCRDMQAYRDRPTHFYMIGSMGTAASLGLGIALGRPEKRVVVCDGDGSVLMGLGALPMVGRLRPENFIHVVFDNEAFASTGGQPTHSAWVALDELAKVSGYPLVRRAQTAQELVLGWREIRRQSGPAFFLVKCKPDPADPMERIRLLPDAIATRFREAVQT